MPDTKSKTGKGQTAAKGSGGYQFKLFDGEMPARYEEFRPAIQKAAAYYNIPEEQLWAILHKESSGKNIPIGADKHGRGAFQIDDRFHKEFLRANDAGMDPETAAAYAASLIRDNLRSFKGDETKALAAYNAGAGGVRKAVRAGKHPDAATHTGAYSQEILDFARQFKEKHMPKMDEREASAGRAALMQAPEDPIAGAVSNPVEELASYVQRMSPESQEVQPAPGEAGSTPPTVYQQPRESLYAGAPFDLPSKRQYIAQYPQPAMQEQAIGGSGNGGEEDEQQAALERFLRLSGGS